MTVTALSLLPTSYQLPASNTPFFQAQSPTQVTSVVFTNVSASTVAITIYIVRANGAPGPSSVLISAFSVGAGVAYVSPELRGKNLGVGDTLWGFAGTGNVVNVSADGFTIS